jgi:putative DNA methylase
MENLNLFNSTQKDQTEDKSHSKSVRRAIKTTPTLLEGNFDIGWVSKIAETESWRKEVYRPVYHVHKWWAQRLGSVFRSLVLASELPYDADIRDEFYKTRALSDYVVFDPFMGSGTTIGETLKLGCRAIGRDINPVAHFGVKVGMQKVDEEAVLNEFERLERTAGEKIKSFFRSKDSSGRDCDVLYYFWVKQIPCESCTADVDLFSNYVFSKHAYAKKHPEAKITCRFCSNVLSARFDANKVTCDRCCNSFDPQKGNAERTTVSCLSCGHSSKITHFIKDSGKPPKHRMYAKMVLSVDGEKEYLPITDEDEKLYQKARKKLAAIQDAYPVVEILAGYNTNQAKNYGYNYWHQMFNERQLLCLSTLASEIAQIEDSAVREFMFCLFSGILEFNNMFASFKGEGTGAVRHMFSHHILKPERTPLEANIWGTPKSSGSFSTLFHRRSLKAIEYKNYPFEIGKESDKVLAGNHPLNLTISKTFKEFSNKNTRLYLSCGSSANTDIQDQSIDLVLTDPPFFDNVHYSELADFFHVWQQHFLQSRKGRLTTRSESEVQDTCPDSFAEKLGNVFKECHRVLKDHGMLAFSYHHSRDEGWSSVVRAVIGSGFEFVNAFPIKAEMSVATPKTSAKEPINFDIILVCRKRGEGSRIRSDKISILEKVKSHVESLNHAGFTLSRNDVRISLIGQLLVMLSSEGSPDDVCEKLLTSLDWISEQSEQLFGSQVALKLG